MSNDLISRKALIEELDNFSMTITGSANAMALTIVDECKKSFERMVNEQPAAYDTEKVIEQIINVKLPSASQKSRIIGIIKRGGADE